MMLDRWKTSSSKNLGNIRFSCFLIWHNLRNRIMSDWPKEALQWVGDDMERKHFNDLLFRSWFRPELLYLTPKDHSEFDNSKSLFEMWEPHIFSFTFKSGLWGG
jgi:hypothetical protein